ncbi:MAG TPA: VOC family protein [Streptosporangiaceae bacterium]|nr:VOC family protein [Streptosporangiaceae bacterium]
MSAGEEQFVDYRLEVVRVPVSDVDRAKDFYIGLGWRLDADFKFDDGRRIVQVTPPGSACSVQFGTGVTANEPGSEQGLELIVDDINSARSDLAGHGAQVSEVFHRNGAKESPGPDPEHRSYQSLASFNDPDGNGWLLQEVTTRLPGRTTSALAAYGSIEALAEALRHAEAAHGNYEKKLGHADPDWPSWYAQYMAAESAGQKASA